MSPNFPSIPSVCERAVETRCLENVDECRVVTRTICTNSMEPKDEKILPRTLIFTEVLDRFGKVCDGSTCKSDGKLFAHISSGYFLEQKHVGREPLVRLCLSRSVRDMGELSSSDDKYNSTLHGLIDGFTSGMEYMIQGGVSPEKLKPVQNFLKSYQSIIEEGGKEEPASSQDPWDGV